MQVVPYNLSNLYNVASLLSNRWKKATEMGALAQQSLSSLCNSISGIIIIILRTAL